MLSEGVTRDECMQVKTEHGIYTCQSLSTVVLNNEHFPLLFF